MFAALQPPLAKVCPPVVCRSERDGTCTIQVGGRQERRKFETFAKAIPFLQIGGKWKGATVTFRDATDEILFRAFL